MYQNGDRAGANAEAMKGVVANLNDHDIVAIVAYLASRPPI
jgi:cytochrome c553